MQFIRTLTLFTLFSLTLSFTIIQRDPTAYRPTLSLEKKYGEKRGLFGAVADVLQTPFNVVSKVVAVPFEVASKVVEAVKPITGDTISGMAQKQLEVWGDVFQLPLEMGSDFAKLPFELIAGIGGKKEGHGALECCTEVPHLNEMMEEVEKLHEKVKTCTARLGEAVMGGAGQRQARGLFSADSALYNIITKPISIVSDVVQLPFKVVGEGVKIPLKLAQTVVNAASPLLGDRLSSILSVPLDTLSKFASLPFEIGANFIQMPFGLAEDLAKLPFGSKEEAAAAKYCCGRMNLVEGMLVSVKQVREAAELCSTQLDQVIATLEDVTLTNAGQEVIAEAQPADTDQEVVVVAGAQPADAGQEVVVVNAVQSPYYEEIVVEAQPAEFVVNDE